MVPIHNTSSWSSSVTTDLYDDEKDFAYVHLVLGIITITGNSFVISYVFSTTKSTKWNLYRYAKFSLAVSDWILGLALVLFGVWDTVVPRDAAVLSSNAFYYIEYPRFNMFTSVGMFHLCTMSVHR